MATNFNDAAITIAGPAATQLATIFVPTFRPAPHVTSALVEQQQQQPPVMEVDSLLVVQGKITVLKVFTHHVSPANLAR